MKKNILIFSLIFVSVIILLVVLFLSFIQPDSEELLTINDDQQSTLILFSGDNCPYCQVVEEYIIANDIENRLDLSIKEVYNNLANAQLFEAKFNQCFSPPRTFGVPFLWHNNFCLVGPNEIIDYLINLES